MTILSYFDLDGTPRARANRGLENVAGVLEDEVQGSPEVGERFLEAVDRVRTGRQERWEETGNAYTVSIGPDHVDIALEEAGRATLTVDVDQFEQAVVDWLAFLRRAA